VAIISDYSFESIALFFTLYENKNIIVPITTKISSDISEKLSIANCKYAIYIENSELRFEEFETDATGQQLISNLKTTQSSGLILFSSGSTGKPKAMIHNLDKLIDSFQGKRGKALTFLIFLMFDHIGGLNTLLNCLSMGLTMVFPVNRNPDHVCSLIERYKVNILPASPTFLNLILISEAYKQYDMSSLKLITYGTEPMPDSLLINLKEVFPRVRFIQTFGTSETGISQTSSKSSTSTFLKINDPDTEYKIVNGELWLKTKTQILGYLNASMERFTSDGWFKTGDMVEETDDGYIKIVGRNSEIINVGGEKVLPSEVESILFQLPDVKDCIVYGETNPITGQMVVAKILFDRNMKPSEAKQYIVSFCKDKFERYKIPAKVVLMSESEYTDRFKKKRN
ncbi:MAG: long-chain fatty acid--CoA ligase, partial [Cyclobacteriaceae bacterium]|nr:long-chain fatty acid--CoA ligase [Cyclobacteriaceae bacterium]